ncbi:glycosyltransferase family 4 protein [Caulobacter sp. LARHSG274]
MIPAERPRCRPASDNPGQGLRLALFSGNYNYTRDGSNQALNRLVAYLLDAGAEVRVYSPTTDRPAFPPQGDLVSVPSMSLPGRAEYRLALGLPRAVRADLRRFAPTAVHLSAPDLLGLQARNFARRHGLPIVASLHTRFETYLGYYGLDWLRPSAERYLQRFYASCDRVLAPNAPLAERLEDQGLGGKVRIWGRGVDRDQFSPCRRDLAWRRSHGVGDDEVVIAFLGRLVMEKALDVWADTLDRLRGLPVRPLVIGEGPMGGWLRGRLPDAIFTGLLTGHELGRAVASSDVLFNPSLTEAFGNATLEAMAAGLAVVCPEAPSTQALVVNGHDGILVRDPAAPAFARTLRSLVADPMRRLRLGRAARAASDRHGWSQSCASVLEVYRSLNATSAALARSAA